VRRGRDWPSSPPPQREQRSSPWPPCLRGGSAGKEGGSRRRAVGREAGDRARLRDLAAPSNSPRRGRRRGGCCRRGPPSLRPHQLDFRGGNSAAAPGGRHLDGISRRRIGELAGRESGEGERCRRARPAPAPRSLCLAAKLHERCCTPLGQGRAPPPPGHDRCRRPPHPPPRPLDPGVQPRQLDPRAEAAVPPPPPPSGRAAPPPPQGCRSRGARLVGERKKGGTREEGDGDRMGWGK
jgi:hypothetical protein